MSIDLRTDPFADVRREFQRAGFCKSRDAQVGKIDRPARGFPAHIVHREPEDRRRLFEIVGSQIECRRKIISFQNFTGDCVNAVEAVIDGYRHRIGRQRSVAQPFDSLGERQHIVTLIVEIGHAPIQEIAGDEQGIAKTILIVEYETVIAKNAQIRTRQSPREREQANRFAKAVAGKNVSPAHEAPVEAQFGYGRQISDSL